MLDSKTELSKYRLDMAKEKLDSAKLLLENKSYKDSIGRSYYAIFTAARALLAMEGEDFARHTGVITYFQKNYIKTRVFDVKFSKYISTAFQIRNNTDYADFYIVSQEDAQEQYEHAVEFYETMKAYLEMQWKHNI